MMSFSGLTRRGRLLAACALSLAAASFSLHAVAAAFPGGFMESDTVTVARPMLSSAQIGGFLPQRGLFTFPAPYDTQGLRITNAADCGGQDCVDMTYSYWRNMSNSAGSNTLYIFVGLDRSRGGQGPTLFSYDKTSDALTEVGPLFPLSSPYSWDSAEGWYFSYGMPTKIYLQSGSRLLRYDVLAKTLETVFDSTSAYPNTVIHQTNSSNDDDVHSATLEDATSYAPLGCMAYKASTKQFYFYPTTGSFDECQIDKSGRYLVIKEKLPQDSCASCDEDNLIVDLKTGAQTALLDKDGAGGHSDLGYGTQLAVDNWNNYANAWRLWDFTQSPLSGGLVYHDNDWNAFAPSHVSWENASASVPVSQQYACGGAANSTGTAYGNEVVCFMLNPVAAASQQRLVVAPVMTDLAASGGNVTCPGCTAYAKDPKGNIDPTGRYFFWVSNMGGARMDAFMVKIPSQVLTGAAGSGSGDTTPPSIKLASPLAGSSLSGTVTVAANASDNLGVASVQFLLDGRDLGSEVTSAPYSTDWDTSTVAAGTHVLSAIAKDAAGNSATAGAVTVTTFLIDLPPAISSIAADVTGPSTATVNWVTSQQANSQVAYGVTANYGATTTLSTSLVTAHSSALTGLSAGTTYHYQVISSNASGIQAVSADRVFTTAAAPVPTALPKASANWQFNAGSGSIAVDSSGNGHTGSLSGGPAWVVGVAGDALAFNGSNQSVSVSNAWGLNAYPLTVSAWFKTTSGSGSQGLVSKYAYRSHSGYQLFMSSGKLCAWYFRDRSDYVWDGTGCTLPTPGYNDGQWHLATFTVGAAGGELYVDGTLKASRAWNGRPGANSGVSALSFALEPGVSASHFQGSLDEIRIYGGSALSAAQVANLYTSFPLASPAAWTHMVNIIATGSSLQKTAGCDGCADASALSQQQLTSSAGGYLEFTATETNSLRSAGLAQVGAGTGYTGMAYAIRLQGGIATVGEKGVYKVDVPFVSGDVFRITVAAGTVSYSKDGTVFYQSAAAPAYPLQASASINSLGGTLSNAVIKTQ